MDVDDTQIYTSRHRERKRHVVIDTFTERELLRKGYESVSAYYSLSNNETMKA